MLPDNPQTEPNEFAEELRQQGFSNESVEVLVRPRTPTEIASEVAFEKFARGAAPTLAELAGINALNANLFSNWVVSAFNEWREYVDVLKRNSEDDFHELVRNVRRKTVALDRDLEKMRQFLEHRPVGFISRTGIRHLLHETSFVGPLVIARVQKELSNLKDNLDYDELGYADSRKNLGRPRGTKRFPGLEKLVCGLEVSARYCYGKFTLDRTCGKGTLIRGLDWFRAHCIANAEWKWLAEDLPAPGRHPLAVYESAMLTARKQAAEFREFALSQGYR